MRGRRIGFIYDEFVWFPEYFEPGTPERRNAVNRWLDGEAFDVVAKLGKVKP